MKVHVVPNAPGAPAALSERTTLLATDLTADTERRSLWRSRGASDPKAAGPSGLAGHGYASPMGYWISPAEEALAPASGGLSIHFAAPGEESPLPTGLALAPDGCRSRPAQTVRIKGPNAGDGDIVLTVGGGGARVVASPGAWKALAQPVLLAICQYWRFCAVDSELARLTELAHGDLAHATMPGPSSLRQSRRLTENAHAARALLLDLPHFQGPLTDALAYCSTERAARAYESLAEKLDLEEWCELIDERAEAVEDSYEALTEKLFEYKNFAWEAVLEFVIVVILLGELGLMIYENFGP
jgi:hypothetical protein